MGVNVLFDGLDTLTAFGVRLEQGGLDIFEMPPTPKEPFFNEWPDQSGRDYDLDAPVVYQTQVFEVPFLIIGSDMADYRKKKRDLLKLLDANRDFDLQILDWGEAFRVRYKGAASWSFINVDLETSTSARFVLRLECNHGDAYVFKYLVDNSGRYIIINGVKVLVKTVIK